jgi:methylated-DNA-[protein]-cysteine S-methyltransferase
MKTFELKHPLVGTIYLAGSEVGLWMVSFNKEYLEHSLYSRLGGKSPDDLKAGELNALLAVKQLLEYFEGERKAFDVPLDFSLIQGPMVRRILLETLSIPYGKTVTYKDIAQRLGTHSRVVGLAMAVNPLAIFVPCHRVLGSDGGLRGYAGGLWVKEGLLRLEGAWPPPVIPAQAGIHPDW